MANSYMRQFFYSFTPMLTGIHGSIAIGSDASVSSFSISGVTSVTKTGTGEYTLTLSSAYNALMFAGASLLSATAQALVPQIKSQTISSTKIVVVNLLSGASPTDPTSACTLYVNLMIRNSSVTK